MAWLSNDYEFAAKLSQYLQSDRLDFVVFKQNNNTFYAVILTQFRHDS